MDTNAKYILEYDFYGALLTKRQQQVINLYHEENLTLAEIAEEFGISLSPIASQREMAATADSTAPKAPHVTKA